MGAKQPEEKHIEPIGVFELGSRQRPKKYAANELTLAKPLPSGHEPEIESTPARSRRSPADVGEWVFWSAVAGVLAACTGWTIVITL